MAKSKAPIVSSAYLAAGRAPALSELEFSLTLMVTAYHRWMVCCMAASGMPQLSPMEVLVLHAVRHRDRPKRFMDVVMVLDVEETYVVMYAVRKLERLALVTTRRAGKEKVIEITSEGVDLCTRYANLRQDLLIGMIGSSDATEDDLSDAARLLRALAGIYNQAARSAATL